MIYIGVISTPGMPHHALRKATCDEERTRQQPDGERRGILR